MNHKRRRLWSLLLSGVLLCNSGPVTALAAEEELAEVLIDETEILIEEEAVILTDEVMLNETERFSSEDDQDLEDEEPEILYPVRVAGVQVTSFNAEDVLEDGSVSYDEGVLYLCDAEIVTEGCGIYAEESLTIVLYGNNRLSASGSEPGIYAAKDLTLQAGDGETPALLVETEEAIRICGTETENKARTGLTVEGGIHLKVSNTGSGDLYTSPEGYVRCGNAEFSEDVSEWTADGSPVEFVSKDHLGTWTSAAEEHYLTCADQNCSLRGDLKLAREPHQLTGEASCLTAAQCSVCGPVGEAAPDNHASAETHYEIREDTHLLVHTCCGLAVDQTGEEAHDWTFALSEDGTSLIRFCRTCKTESDRNTITAPEPNQDEKLVWDGQPKAASIEQGTILYYKDSVPEDGMGGSTEAPVEPGTYVAVAILDAQTLSPSVCFTIEKRPLDTMTLETVEDKEYNGSRLEPSSLLLYDGEQTLSPDHYQVTYARQDPNTGTFDPTQNVTDAGTIQVTLTANPEDPHYTGSISTTYQITKAMVPDMVFEPVFPDESRQLVYDGTEKQLECRLKSKYAKQGFGAGTVEFYQTVQGETVQTDALDAGVYQVKIRVAESGNYRETLLEKEAWTLTILPTEAYRDHTKPTQTVGPVVGEWEAPSFTGVVPDGADAPEAVTGTIHYTYGDGCTTENAEEVQIYLDGLADGATALIRYTFTPDSENYAPISEERTILVQKVALTFRMENGSEEDPLILLKNGTVTYGDEEIVDVSHLTATANRVTDGEDSHFTVKYAMLSNSGYDTANLLDSPEAGSVQFFVYYSNEDLGGICFRDVEVTSGYLTVEKKMPSISKKNQPMAVTILADGEEHPLLPEGGKGRTDAGLPLEYSLKQGGPYSETVPVICEPGLYTLWYRPAEQKNYVYPTEAKSVQVIAAPCLTAVYGETLADLQSQLPEGFAFNYANPVTNEVGDAGKHTVLLDYTHPQDDVELPWDYPTLTGYAVPLTVEPRQIRAEIRMTGTHFRYTVDGEGAPVEKRPSVQVYYETEEGMSVLPKNAYRVQYRNNRYPGYADVEITSKNYCFTEDSVTQTSFVIYRPGIYGLAFVPDTLKDRFAGTESLQEALLAGLKEKDPDSTVFYNIKMQEYDEPTGHWQATAEEFYCPENGISCTISYPKGTDRKTHTFEAVGIDTMSAAENRNAEPVELILTEQGIRFQLDGYAAVCLAWREVQTEQEADVTETRPSKNENTDKESPAEPVPVKKYTLKRNASVRGQITFTVGDDPTEWTSVKAKPGELVTIHIRNVKADYEIVRVEYYATKGGYDADTAPDVLRDSNGSYCFEMPEHNTSIKVTFRKSSGNPRTGDDFPMVFWTGQMLVSGTGIMLLARKRRRSR